MVQVEANRDLVQIEKVQADLRNREVSQEIKKNLVRKKILAVKVVFQETKKISIKHNVNCHSL